MLLIFFSVLNVYTSYLRMKDTVEESIASQSLEAAKSIAASMDTETYEKFLSNPEKNESFREIQLYLSDARAKLGSLFAFTLEVGNLDNYQIGDVCIIPKEQVNRSY